MLTLGSGAPATTLRRSSTRSFIEEAGDARYYVTCISASVNVPDGWEVFDGGSRCLMIDAERGIELCVAPIDNDFATPASCVNDVVVRIMRDHDVVKLSTREEPGRATVTARGFQIAGFPHDEAIVVQETRWGSPRLFRISVIAPPELIEVGFEIASFMAQSVRRGE